MKKTIFLFIIFTILTSCNQSKVDTTVDSSVDSSSNESKVIIDLKSIAGKSKIEVDKILGVAEKEEPFSERSTPCKDKPCIKAFYQKDKFEIIFINGKADWITVNYLSEYDFNEDNIELFGLSKAEPEFVNPQDLIRWKNIENIKQVSIFNDGSDKIYYAYIKVASE